MASNSKEKQKEYDAKRRKRSRGWACIVYPESAPENWMQTLQKHHIETLISPLHDMDETAEGTTKKAHWHVLLMFDNPVPSTTAAEIFKSIGVTSPPELVKTIRGYARYLIHLDDHDKYRYEPKNVIELCGASWNGTALDQAEETDIILDDIEEWIDDNNVISYHAVCRYARYERPEWKHTVRTHSIHLKAYLQSIVWEINQE